MEYLRQKVRALTLRFLHQTEPPAVFSRKDAYLNFTYKVLMWEEPALSWMVLLIFHFVFWLFVHLQIRIYATVFLSLLFAFVLDTYFERSGLQEPRTASSDALRHVYDVSVGLFRYLKQLRKDSPSAFCLTVSISFLFLNFIARNVSGYLFAYLLVLFSFFGPLAVSQLPRKYVESLKDTIQTISRGEGDLAELELMPFIADRELNEKDIDLDSLTDRTGDSVTNSLISGITSMPSHLDVEGEVDGLEEEDLEPSVTPSQASLLTFIPAVEYSSDSDESEVHRNMEFKSSHFSPDSSSEEESSYTKDLNFTDAKDVTQEGQEAASSIGGILSNLGSIGSSLVSNVIMSAVTKETPRKQDSDSDFEIISNEELDEQQ